MLHYDEIAIRMYLAAYNSLITWAVSIILVLSYICLQVKIAWLDATINKTWYIKPAQKHFCHPKAASILLLYIHFE